MNTISAKKPLVPFGVMANVPVLLLVSPGFGQDQGSFGDKVSGLITSYHRHRPTMATLGNRVGLAWSGYPLLQDAEYDQAVVAARTIGLQPEGESQLREHAAALLPILR